MASHNSVKEMTAIQGQSYIVKSSASCYGQSAMRQGRILKEYLVVYSLVLANPKFAKARKLSALSKRKIIPMLELWLPPGSSTGWSSLAPRLPSVTNCQSLLESESWARTTWSNMLPNFKPQLNLPRACFLGSFLVRRPLREPHRTMTGHKSSLRMATFSRPGHS